MLSTVYRLRFGSVSFQIISQADSFGLYQNIPERTVAKDSLGFHNHPSYEFFAVVKGEIAVMTLDGKHTYRESVVVIPPKFSHYINYNNTTLLLFSFTVSPENALSEAFQNPKEPFSLPFTSAMRFYCNKLVFSINRESGISLIEPLVYLLFAEIFEPYFPKNDKKEKRTHNVEKHFDYISDIDRYIVTHLKYKITLNDLAEQLHLCTKQVARIVKKEYGFTVSELVRFRKINVSMMMLTKTDLPIREIAAEVGYDTVKDFSLNFKRVCGISPSEHRRTQRLLGEKGSSPKRR